MASIPRRWVTGPRGSTREPAGSRPLLCVLGLPLQGAAAGRTVTTSSTREQCGVTEALSTARWVTAASLHRALAPSGARQSFTQGLADASAEAGCTSSRPQGPPFSTSRLPPPAAVRASDPREEVACSHGRPESASPDGRGSCGPGVPLTRTRGPVAVPRGPR